MDGAFVMAGINTRIVRRSAGLLPDHYGEGFTYDERMLVGEGPGAALKATGVAVGMGAGMGAMSIGPLRRRIAPRLPAPGEGPSKEEQENGYWTCASGRGARRTGGDPLRARLLGDRDPGYGSTSKMLAESALCLAEDALDSAPGFLTPAAAMGDALVERLLTHAGVTFEVDG